MLTLQEIIRRLRAFWADQGCCLHQGYDLEVGAGTFNPATFFRCLGPEPYRAAYVEPSRRPQDGRYGENPNRMQFFHQFQVILKPSPLDMQEIYLRSLEALGYDLSKHDIRFIHDDWEQPSLGAWGLGWEVWRDGMEVTQFTYFQAVGGIECRPVTAELAYGIERLAMDLQQVDNVYDLMWNETLSYGDIFRQNEVEWSHYNFEQADTAMWGRQYREFVGEVERLVANNLPIPAYDFLMKACHAFNILDARGTVSVTERPSFIAQLRTLSCQVAQKHLDLQKERGFPLLSRQWTGWRPTPQAEASKLRKVDFAPEKRDDFLLEIGSEELPAAFLPIACANLKRDLTKLLETLQLSYEEIEVDATPRRLAARVTALAGGVPASVEERRGPPASIAFDESGEPTQVGLGFFGSVHQKPVTRQAIVEGGSEGLELREVKGKEYLFARLSIPSQSAHALLSERLGDLVLGIDFPKRMRWSDLDISYARPLQWLVALHGSEVIPFAVGHLVSGRTSRGHRQLCNRDFSLAHASDYLDQCREHKVLVAIHERQASIEEQLASLEAKHHLVAVSRERVVSQVVHMVEWPELALGSFREDFLRVPQEVLISEMVEHQKYFPMADRAGKLVAYYVITADRNPTAEVVKGNTKVLSARLADGIFLYEQDSAIPLKELKERTKGITYREGLGSIFDKAERMAEYVPLLAQSLKLHAEEATIAAGLCKADLASEMVGEFPELQGVIGGYYARAHGESEQVATAIAEHYQPVGESSPLPSTDAGTLVALADKIDNLLSCFALGLVPTSSSDPYALRRQVLGMIRIFLDRKWDVNLRELFEKCYKKLVERANLTHDDNVINQLEAFFWNRIRTVFQEQGIPKDTIEAALYYNQQGVYDSYRRAEALERFRKGGAFPHLVEVFKRIHGLLPAEIESRLPEAFQKELCTEKAELDLADQWEAIRSPLIAAQQDRDYGKAYGFLAQLQPALTRFFEEVKVLDDDLRLRNNRLALLCQVRGSFSRLLDFSKLRLG